MTLRVGINGFGRIGRTVLRCLQERQDGDLVVMALNDPAPHQTLAHLFEFDSLHGRYPHAVTLDGTTLNIGTTPIRMSSASDPDTIAWSDVDLVLECSGKFTNKDAACRHLKSGASKVLISAPSNKDVKTIVYGVNDAEIKTSDQLLSNGSCTTNCLVPVVAILDAAYGIDHGMMTTVHSYTSTQNTQDSPHDDLYRARAAALSMIPTTTGAAETLGEVLPHLAGRITGHAIRVPTPNISCIDLVVTLKTDTDVDHVNKLFHSAAQGAYRGILAATDRQLVSLDFKQDPHSAIVATDQTRLQGGRLLRVLAWYDNEWGFSNRLIDTARVFGGLPTRQLVTP